MYTYNVDEKEINNLLEEQEKKTAAPATEEELNEILKQIEKDNSWAQGEIGDYIKQEVNLERLDAGEFDEQQARSQAENHYGQEIIDGKAAIEDNALKEAAALENQKITLAEETDKNKEALEQIFGTRKEEAKKDAINRGLARSSIIINKIEAFDENMIAEYNKLNMEYSKSFLQIENTLSMLQTQKENALKNFDLSYAVKINEKIDELKKEYDKKVDEVAKYNNEIALKEAEFNSKESQREQEYNKNIIDSNMAYLEAVKKFGADAVNKQVQDAKFPYIEAYFKSLPADEAYRKLVGTTYWLDQIGSVNLVKLANEIAQNR